MWHTWSSYLDILRLIAFWKRSPGARYSTGIVSEKFPCHILWRPRCSNGDNFCLSFLCSGDVSVPCQNTDRTSTAFTRPLINNQMSPLCHESFLLVRQSSLPYTWWFLIHSCNRTRKTDYLSLPRCLTLCDDDDDGNDDFLSDTTTWWAMVIIISIPPSLNTKSIVTVILHHNCCRSVQFSAF